MRHVNIAPRLRDPVDAPDGPPRPALRLGSGAAGRPASDRVSFTGMTRILVTGGAGYVGSVSVAGVPRGRPRCGRPRRPDDRSSGRGPGGATLHAGHLRGPGRHRPGCCRSERIEAILHCAARSLVGESIADPSKYYRDNVAGGVALLEAARATGVERVVFSSTAAVYGIPDATPIPEDAPLRPINPYGETKRTFEGALGWYGAGLRAAQRQPSLLQRGRRDRRARRGPRPGDAPHPERPRRGRGQRPTLTVFGDDYPTPDGTCIRDYIHVADLADAHLRAHRGDRARRPADRRAARLQPRQRRRLLDPRGDRRGRARGRPRDPVHGRAAPRRRSAGPRGPVDAAPRRSSAGAGATRASRRWSARPGRGAGATRAATRTEASAARGRVAGRRGIEAPT